MTPYSDWQNPTFTPQGLENTAVLGYPKNEAILLLFCILRPSSGPVGAMAGAMAILALLAHAETSTSGSKDGRHSAYVPSSPSQRFGQLEEFRDLQLLVPRITSSSREKLRIPAVPFVAIPGE